MALRILLLDDNPDDRALTSREVVRAFPGVEILEGSDRAGFDAAMASGPIDLVVTDFQMRWTTGLDIVRLVKAHWPEIPVIMFTATGTQEIAVEAMKAGLDDYVIKSPRHYIRLAVSVRAALDRTEIRLRAIRSEKRLATLLESIEEGALRLSLEGEMVDANRAFRVMAGLDAGAAASPLVDACRACLPELAATGDRVEREFQDASGAETRFFSIRFTRVRVNGHDAVDGLVSDVTRLTHTSEALRQLNATLESQVEERTGQLRAANEALEAFAFSISHDLREPLRTIQGYVRALGEDCGATMPSQGRTYLQRTEAVAARMDQMIADLLDFSRLSLEDIPLRPTELRAALDEAWDAVISDPALRSAELRRDGVGDWRVLAHPATLVQVLTNLLSNAAKFHQHGQRAQVEVRAQGLDGQVRLTVANHGIGVAPADQQRIFNVFERLHGEENYPGTGIGLAVVKKGVERMHGRVGLESSLGQGARFWIDLPKA